VPRAGSPHEVHDRGQYRSVIRATLPTAVPTWRRDRSQGVRVYRTGAAAVLEQLDAALQAATAITDESAVHAR
jgi:hypothetical protein